MAVKIVIGIYVSAILFALLRPRTAILLFWPLLYCYPHWLLFEKLPLNVGLDDIFVLSLFIGSLIRSGGKLQVKWPFIMAILFWVIVVLGDASSIATGGLNITLLWKHWLKSLGLILFVYSVSSLITAPEQIKKAVYSLLFGALLGAVFIIYYTVVPHAYNPFQIPYWIRGVAWESRQTIGPFYSGAIAGGVLGFAVLIGYFYIRFAKDKHKRPIIIIVTAVLFFSLMLCTARKGWLFVLFPVILSSLLSKQKILGIFLLAVITIGVVVTFTYFRIFSERVDWTIWQMTGGTLQSVTSNRWLMWREHLANVNIKWLFCGEGFAMMGGAHVHSNYIGILMNMGLAGALFWFVYYVKVIKKSSWLKRYDPNPDMATLFQAVFWCYIGYFAFFIAATPVQWPNVRYIDFFLMTLVHLRYKQIESEAEYVLEDELYQHELSYDQDYQLVSYGETS